MRRPLLVLTSFLPVGEVGVGEVGELAAILVLENSMSKSRENEPDMRARGQPRDENYTHVFMSGSPTSSVLLLPLFFTLDGKFKS